MDHYAWMLGKPTSILTQSFRAWAATGPCTMQRGVTPSRHCHRTRTRTVMHAHASARGPSLAPHVPGPRGDVGEITAPPLTPCDGSFVPYRSPPRAHALPLQAPLLVSPRGYDCVKLCAVVVIVAP